MRKRIIHITWLQLYKIRFQLNMVDKYFSNIRTYLNFKIFSHTAMTKLHWIIHFFLWKNLFEEIMNWHVRGCSTKVCTISKVPVKNLQYKIFQTLRNVCSTCSIFLINKSIISICWWISLSILRDWFMCSFLHVILSVYGYIVN